MTLFENSHISIYRKCLFQTACIIFKSTTCFSYEDICVEFERKNNKALAFLLSNCPQVSTSDPLNIIFDDFGK